MELRSESEMTESRRRGARAMRDAVKAGPRVDSYSRRVDIRGAIEREDAERARRRRV